MRVVVDTNTYSAFMSGSKNAIKIFQSAEELLVPVPVLAELRFGFLKGTKGQKNELVLHKFMDSLRVKILSCDEGTTQIYALLKLQLSRQGTPIPINDIWIAALVIQHGAHLYSLDKDFDRIPQLPRV